MAYLRHRFAGGRVGKEGGGGRQRELVGRGYPPMARQDPFLMCHNRQPALYALPSGQSQPQETYWQMHIPANTHPTVQCTTSTWEASPAHLLALGAGEYADPVCHQVLLAGALDLRRRHQEVLGQLELSVVLHHPRKLGLRGGGQQGAAGRSRVSKEG